MTRRIATRRDATSHLLSRTFAPAALALIIGSAGAASSDTAAGSSPPPVFSKAETRTIERNASLRKALPADPWIVRKALDKIAASSTGTRIGGVATEGSGVKMPIEAFEPAGDPDLDGLERSSPEAALDLFLLLQRAGGKQKN